MPWYSKGTLEVSGLLELLKVILYLDPSGAKTLVPLLPTVNPLKSRSVTSLTILYLSVGNVGSAACVWNCVGLFNLPAFTSSVTNFLIVEASRSIPSLPNFLDM